MTISWPAELPLSWSIPEPRNFAKSGGSSGSGREQRVFADAGLWEVSAQVRVRDRASLNAYSALIARLREGEDVLLPIVERGRADGSNDSGSSLSLSADAALRAVALSIASTGVVLVSGANLTIGDRLYRIKQVTTAPASAPELTPWHRSSPWNDATLWQADSDEAGSYAVKITPPLRVAAVSGAPVQSKNLVLRCVLKDLGDGDLSPERGGFGAISLTFIEAI